MLVTRIGFDTLSDNTPRSIDADSPPVISRLRRWELESLPVRRNRKGSVSARSNERLLVMVVVNAGESSEPSLDLPRRQTWDRCNEGCSILSTCV